MSDSSHFEPEARANELLQLFFDRRITDAESEELLQLQALSPEIELTVRKDYWIEQTLQYYRDVETKMSGERFRQLLDWGLKRFGFEPEDKTDDFSFEQIDFDRLAEMAVESPSLSRQSKPEKTAPRNEKSKTSSLAVLTRRQILQLSAICLAVFLVVALPLAYMEFRLKQSPPSHTDFGALARVTSIVDPRFAIPSAPLATDEAGVLRKNQKLDTQTVRLASGMLQLELVDKTRVVLEGDTEFNLQSPMLAFCQRGRVSIEIPKDAEGFEVKTPFMNIRDLGTKFVVEVSDTESRVHVIEGRVEIDALNGHVTERSEGMGMIVRSGGSVEQIQADNSLFVERTKMKQVETRYEDALHAALTRHQSRLIQEPDLLALVDFSSGVDAVTKGSFETVRGRKTMGRWFGRTAFSFESPKDTVRLSVSGRSRSLTLFAVVRLKDLSHPGNILFSLGGMDNGSLRWQINQSGDLQLMLGKQDGSSFADHAAPKALRKADCETWLTVATVLDAKNRTVTHYLDGKEIASLPLTEDAEYDFSQSEIGNGRSVSRNAETKRYFNGQIEEFILIGRPLTFNEITELK